MQSPPQTTPVAFVAPECVPARILSTGARMPAIGLGTVGSDHASPSAVADAVKYAASIDYRQFDCASVDGNNERIGHVFKELFQNGLRRDEACITSKLWNDKHGENDVIPSCERSLADLQLKYLDLYLVYWPFPNHHPPRCDDTARNPNAVPYVHENYLRTWRKMEELVDRGLVRHIGTSRQNSKSADPRPWGRGPVGPGQYDAARQGPSRTAFGYRTNPEGGFCTTANDMLLPRPK